MNGPRAGPPGTTWFLRDRAEIDALVSALSRDSTPSRQVRIWSVGCSTGQEPYSITMALLAAGLQPQVLATDLRPEALAVAAAARYPVNAVSVLPPVWRQRYTTPISPDEIAIHSAVVRRVSFQLHDLARSPEPPLGWSRFDAVVCRNVLIYFERADAVAIVKRLAGACRLGGYVLLSAAERPLAWMTAMLIEDDEFKDSVLLRLAPQKPPGLSLRTPFQPAIPLVPLRLSASQAQGAASGSPAQGVADAAALLHRGDFARALAIVDDVLARDRLDAAAHLVRGLALKHTGETEEAAAALRCARFLFSNDAWMAPYQLGIVLEQLGSLADAAEAYRHALAVIRSGGRSGLPVEGQPDDALLETVQETCRARLRALAGPRIA